MHLENRIFQICQFIIYLRQISERMDWLWIRQIISKVISSTNKLDGGLIFHLILPPVRVSFAFTVFQPESNYTITSRIKQIFLPPYSPNLNLIERLWKFLRKKVINTGFYRNKAEFRLAINKSFAKIGDYREELESLLTLKFRLVNSQTISFWLYIQTDLITDFHLDNTSYIWVFGRIPDFGERGDYAHTWAIARVLTCKIPSKGVIVRSCYDSHCIKWL